MQRSVPVLVVLLLVLTGSPAAAGKASAEPSAKAGNAFAVDLYKKLAAEPGNVFFSPWSVSTALAMTRQGAKGETAAQMDRVLHRSGVQPASDGALIGLLRPGKVRDGYGKDAKEVDAFALHTANAVWVQEGLPIVPEFGRVLTANYGAPPRSLDFKEAAAARKVINDWVAKETRDRIRDILPEGLPTPDTLLALANAIYFQAAWKHPFEKRWTREAPFTVAAGREVTVPMMVQAKELRYAETDAVEVLEIPYRGDETSMVVVLPKEKDGLAGVEADLSAERIGEWIGKAEVRNVGVNLPRFETTQSFDLTGTLPAMGMTDAFDAKKADFSGMTEAEPLYIGAVVHKAFVKVDEAGTEAAAATVVMVMKGGRPAESVAFVADHPFLFLIRHRATGAILFMGRITDPTQAG